MKMIQDFFQICTRNLECLCKMNFGNMLNLLCAFHKFSEKEEQNHFFVGTVATEK